MNQGKQMVGLLFSARISYQSKWDLVTRWLGV